MLKTIIIKYILKSAVNLKHGKFPAKLEKSTQKTYDSKNII